MFFKNSSSRKSLHKFLTIGMLGIGLMVISAKGFAQSAPPPPPAPEKVIKDVGKTFKKINPFKKNGKLKGPDGKAVSAPPPPPDPLNLFKKRKGRSALPPPPGPGRD